MDVPLLNSALEWVSHIQHMSGFTWACTAGPRASSCNHVGHGRGHEPISLGQHLNGKVGSMVSSAEPNRWHQRDSVILLSTLLSIEMKRCLKICIALSARLRLWLPGGTKSCVIPFSLMHSLKAVDALLSSLWCLSPGLAVRILFTIHWYTAIISPSVLFFIGLQKI